MSLLTNFQSVEDKIDTAFRYSYSIVNHQGLYRSLEYIEGTGTQYINTNVPGNAIYGLEFKYIPVALAFSWVATIGCTRDNFTLGQPLNNTLYLRWRTEEVFNGVSVSINSINTFKILNNKISLNDHSWSRNTSLSIDTTSKVLSIFRDTDMSDAAMAKIKFYELTLYAVDNITVTHKYIPVKRSGDNAIGLYDLITNEFLNNAGTGTFIAGPEI